MVTGERSTRSQRLQDCLRAGGGPRAGGQLHPQYDFARARFLQPQPLDQRAQIVLSPALLLRGE